MLVPSRNLALYRSSRFVTLASPFMTSSASRSASRSLHRRSCSKEKKLTSTLLLQKTYYYFTLLLLRYFTTTLLLLYYYFTTLTGTWTWKTQQMCSRDSRSFVAPVPPSSCSNSFRYISAHIRRCTHILYITITYLTYRNIYQYISYRYIGCLYISVANISAYSRTSAPPEAARCPISVANISVYSWISVANTSVYSRTSARSGEARCRKGLYCPATSIMPVPCRRCRMKMWCSSS